MHGRGFCNEARRDRNQSNKAIANSQLKLLNRWATDSRMRLNFSKSTVMWFKTSKRTQRHYPPIVVGDVVLNVVTNQRYLGLVFDQNLSWDQHVSHICKRMLYICYSLSLKCSKFQVRPLQINFLFPVHCPHLFDYFLPTTKNSIISVIFHYLRFFSYTHMYKMTLVNVAVYCNLPSSHIVLGLFMTCKIYVKKVL